MGDIAVDILGIEGSRSSGFKPGSTKINSGSRKKKIKKRLDCKTNKSH
jgi:hypothetical protein